MTEHIVQKGDTLWKISRAYGVSFEQLKKVNAHLANPDYIVPGMKVTIPENVTSEKKKQDILTDRDLKKKEIKEEQPTTSHVKKEQSQSLETPPIPLPTLEEKVPKITSTSTDKEKNEIEFVKKKEKAPKKEVAQKQLTKEQQTEEAVPPQFPTVPMQPVTIIGIPCGWMPIYDYDCHPHASYSMHHAQFPHPNQLPIMESSIHLQAPRPKVKHLQQNKTPALTTKSPSLESPPLYTPSIDMSSDMNVKGESKKKIKSQQGQQYPTKEKHSSPLQTNPQLTTSHYQQPSFHAATTHHQQLQQCAFCHQPIHSYPMQPVYPMPYSNWPIQYR